MFSELLSDGAASTPSNALKLMAERIAHNARFMGLDDKDERLLWHYVAQSGEGLISDAVVECLKEQGELEAVLVGRVEAYASIDSKWVRGFALLPALRRPLRQRLVLSEGLPLFVCFLSRGEVIKRAAKEAQHQAFSLWYSSLCASRVEGRLVEASADDVHVELKAYVRDLRETISTAWQ